MTKLSDAQVSEIRKRLNPCPICGRKPTYKSVAKDFGVSTVTVLKISRREIHKDVD